MNAKQFIPILFCLASFGRAAAQIEPLEAGSHLATVHVGANYLFNGITALPATIIPGHFSDTTFSTENCKTTGFTIGFGYEFRPTEWLGLGGGPTLSKRAGGYRYQDIENLTYDMDFSYWFAGLDLYAKLIYKGAFVKIGLQPSLNVARENIKYCHRPTDQYGACEPVQAELRQVLKGRPDLGFTGGLGYEMQLGETGNGLFVEAAYYHGVSDVMATMPNGYGFSNPKNLVRSCQLTVGAQFTLNN